MSGYSQVDLGPMPVSLQSPLIETYDAMHSPGVNRLSVLTPNRRAKLTPLSVTAEVVPVVNRGDPRGFV